MKISKAINKDQKTLFSYQTFARTFYTIYGTLDEKTKKRSKYILRKKIKNKTYMKLCYCRIV